MVKALDSKSNEIFPHRFDPCLKRIYIFSPKSVFFLQWHKITKKWTKTYSKPDLNQQISNSCEGRVVKALDSKSNGIFPHRFEPCSQRIEISAPKSVFFCSDTKSQRNGQKVSQNQIWTNKIATAVMAEWLRRWTRNPMGSSRTGSNPVHSALTFLHLKVFFFVVTQNHKEMDKRIVKTRSEPTE